MIKSITVHHTRIIFGITLCLVGLGFLASLSYDDYVNHTDADVSVISTLEQPVRSSTTYVTGSENHVLSTQFPSIPMGITVTENHSDLVNAPNRLVFESLWIPLLVIGSYILVHTDYAVLSGVKQ